MSGLLLKDILNLKSYVTTLVVCIVGYGIIFLTENTGVSAFAIMMFAMVVITTIAYDKQAKWNKYALTMPLTRKDIILSKYIFFVASTIIGAIIGFVLSVIPSILSEKNLEVLTVFGIISVALGMAFLFGSISLPVIFKIGVEKARIIIICCTVLPVGILLLLGKLVDFETMVRPSDGFLLGVFILVAIVGALLLIPSYMISLRIFTKKDF